MAHNRQQIYEQAQSAIKKNNLFFIEDIIAFIPCSKFYFYDAFPVDSNEYNNLKSLLEENKVKTKSAIRSKLFKSNKAAELLALYRLICTKEEHQLLNQQYIDHTTKGEVINDSIDYEKLSDNALREIANARRK